MFPFVRWIIFFFHLMQAFAHVIFNRENSEKNFLRKKKKKTETKILVYSNGTYALNVSFCCCCWIFHKLCFIFLLFVKKNYLFIFFPSRLFQYILEFCSNRLCLHKWRWWKYTFISFLSLFFWCFSLACM